MSLAGCYEKVKGKESNLGYYGIIYLLTNKKNGKVYVGQTVKDLQDRFWEHKTDSKRVGKNGNKLYRAAKKYGWENFDKVIIDYAKNADELNVLEMHYIAHFQSMLFGYNCDEGGASGKWSEEAKLKMSTIQKEIFKDPEIRRRISEGTKAAFAKDPSIKQRIIKSLKKPIICKETGKKYDGIVDAAKELGIHKDSIGRNLKGLYLRAGGFTFEYITKI